MSVGPFGGVTGAAAGTPLSQSSGSDVDRTRQDAVSQQRKAQAAEKADDAAGIAKTDGEDKESHDRDADGRRLWEKQPEGEEPAAEDEPESPRKSRDATGMSGNQLDLSG